MGKDTTSASKSTPDYGGAHWYLVTPDYGSSMRVVDGLLLEADDHEELFATPRHSKNGVLKFHVEAGAVWLYVCHADWLLSSSKGPISGPFEVRCPAMLRFADWVAYLTMDVADSCSDSAITLVLERKPVEPTIPFRFVLVEEASDQSEENEELLSGGTESEAEPSMDLRVRDSSRSRIPSVTDRIQRMQALEVDREFIAEPVLAGARLGGVAAVSRMRAKAEDDIPILLNEYVTSAVEPADAKLQSLGEIWLPEPEPEPVGHVAPKSIPLQSDLWTTDRPSYLAGVRPGPKERNRSTSVASSGERSLPEPRKRHRWLAWWLLICSLILSMQAQGPAIALNPESAVDLEEQAISAERLVRAVDDLVKDKGSLDAVTIRFVQDAYEAVGHQSSDSLRRRDPESEETDPAGSEASRLTE